MKVGLPLMNYTLKPLAKSILIPLALMAAVLVKDTAIQEKIHGSGMTTLIISNEEMNYIITLVKSLEESGLLTESVSETIENEAKEQKRGFRGMLLDTLGVSF